MDDPNNNFDLAEYALSRVSAPPIKTTKFKSSKRAVEKFLKGPVPLIWLIAAGELPGKTMVVGVGLWFLSGLTGSKTVKPTGKLWKSLSISRQAAYRAIAALEKRGLVEVIRQPGCAPVVTLRSLSETEPN